MHSWYLLIFFWELLYRSNFGFKSGVWDPGISGYSVLIKDKWGTHKKLALTDGTATKTGESICGEVSWKPFGIQSRERAMWDKDT